MRTSPLPVTRPRTVGRLGWVTALVVAALASSARADTTQTITGTTTISGTPVSDWNTSSTKAGTFGAGFTNSQYVQADPSGNETQEGDNTVSAEVFGSTVNVVDTEGLANTDGGGSDGNFHVTFAGAYAYKDATNALTSSELTFELCTADLGSTVANATGSFEATIMAGPIPVTVEAGLDTCGGVSLEAERTENISSSYLKAQITPFVKMSLAASAGLGTSEASVGVYGELEMIDESVPITLVTSVNPSTSQLTHSASAVLTLTSLAGSVGVYAKLLFIKYEYKFISWSGITLGSAVLYTDSVPVAADPEAVASGQTLYGQYVYYDSADLDDQSTYQWYRGSKSDGSDATVVDTNQNHRLGSADNNQYLRFCVTPYNGKNPGDQKCTGYFNVGPVLRLFKDASESGTEVDVPYLLSPGGTCFNLADSAYNLDNALSSFVFNGPSGTNATIGLYDSNDCSGTPSYQSVSAGGSTQLANMGTLGMNDTVGSILVVTTDNVAVSDLSFALDGMYARVTYTFEDDNGLDESGTVYHWYMNYNSDGASVSSCASNGSCWIDLGTSTSPDYQLKTYYTSHSDIDIGVCVTPSDGYTSGATTCSNFLYLGDVFELGKDTNFTGTNIYIPMGLASTGTCFNLSDAGFDNVLSAWQEVAMEQDFARLALFKDANCTGSSVNDQWGCSDMGSCYGSGWNDSVSSIQFVKKGDVPTASSVSLTITNNHAVGSYTYADASGVVEGTSTFLVERADDSGGTTNVTGLSTTNDHYLSSDDNRKWMRFCVTPVNAGGNSGSQACSDWTSVGPVETLYQDENYGSSHLSFALYKVTEGTCLNLTEYGFNDVLSSLTVNAADAHDTEVVLYQDINCTGSAKGVSATAGNSNSVDSTSTRLGSGWNDSVTSIRFYYQSAAVDVPRGPAAAISISGNTATGSYSYTDSFGATESGSTYMIKRASDANGTGVTTVGTSKSYTLQPADNGMYLRFCVYPSDGTFVGPIDCSAWTAVGHLLQLYKDDGYSSTNLNFAYEKSASGTCVNLASYSYANVLSSFILNAPTNGPATVWFYKTTNCSGTTATVTNSSPGTSYGMTSMHTSMGSTWNDTVQSFWVTY